MSESDGTSPGMLALLAGPLPLDEDGLARRGTVCRRLGGDGGLADSSLKLEVSDGGGAFLALRPLGILGCAPRRLQERTFEKVKMGGTLARWGLHAGGEGHDRSIEAMAWVYKRHFAR